MKIIDARAMQPPEPFEHVMEALTELALGDRVKLILNHEPRPLYRFLERNRYAYEMENFDDGRFEILIWELPG